MKNLIMTLLPKKYVAMIKVAENILQNVDTAEERAEIVEHINEMFAETGSGGTRVTMGEWAKLGGKLGILKAK